MAHNLHVLIEKPFVTDIRQAQELIAVAQRQRRLIMVSQNYRWCRNVLTLKNAIDSKRSIHLDDLGAGYGVYLINDRQEKTRADDVTPKLEGIDGVLSAFARAIINEQQPPSSAEDNLHTLPAVFATSASSREGRPVQPLSLLA